MNKTNFKDLSKGKKKLYSFGLKTVWLLNNGWYAQSRKPENGWHRSIYWTIYRTPQDFNDKDYFAGGTTLTRALENAIQETKNE